MEKNLVHAAHTEKEREKKEGGQWKKSVRPKQHKTPQITRDYLTALLVLLLQQR